MNTVDFLPFASVLERALELLKTGTRERPVTFGWAVHSAADELGVPVQRGSEVEDVLVRCAFSVLTSGRLPGCPDAG